MVCVQEQLPMVVAGDFNLVLETRDKSTGHVDVGLMGEFNNWVADLALMEIKRTGSKFTWTNKQARPVFSNIDRVFTTTEWENNYPLCSMYSILRVGSDHVPIIIDNGEVVQQTARQFFFEQQWLTQEGFKEGVIKRWNGVREKSTDGEYSVDTWHKCVKGAKQFMKGWGNNQRGEYRRKKQSLLDKLKELDARSENDLMTEELWEERYRVEAELEKVYAEELYWQQRGGEKWILKGDTNTGFFHMSANGRKRKKAIVSLQNQGVNVTDPEEIRKIIYDYYKELFGSEDRKGVVLMDNVWESEGRVTENENIELTKPFTIEEAEQVVKEMKENTAPGPDGLSVSFYKNFWGIIKGEIGKMIEDFNSNKLDLARLNYGVITLIPKVQEANNIRQYRTICVSNVIFKIFTRMMMNRMTTLVDKIISRSQSAFIKGRYILDSAVILREVLHELRVKKMSGVIMKIDFEKAYDRINWDFLEEVMRLKGFHEQFIKWVMLSVKTGRVSININGNVGSYFRTYRGLRQRDPISLILFNIAADTLAYILDRAKLNGQLKGVVPHLVTGGLTHIQYADDTVILMACEEQSISHMKFLLYCFE